MSDIPADYAERLNLKEQLARIDRTQAELSKLLEEQPKLTAERRKLDAEHDKLAAERDKLMAERLKLERDRLLAPIIASGAVAAAIGVVLPWVLRGFGLIP